MLSQIEEVQKQGFVPVIFIDNELNMLFCSPDHELQRLKKEAMRLKVPVYTTSNLLQLVRTRKAYVFRYGNLPKATVASICRNLGKVVPGNLIV